MLIELICNEQTHMIIKDHTKYDSEKYKKEAMMEIMCNKNCKTCKHLNTKEFEVRKEVNTVYEISKRWFGES